MSKAQDRAFRTIAAAAWRTVQQNGSLAAILKAHDERMRMFTPPPLFDQLRLPPMTTAMSTYTSVLPTIDLGRQFFELNHLRTADFDTYTSTLSKLRMDLAPVMNTSRLFVDYFPSIGLPESIVTPAVSDLLRSLAKRYPSNWPEDDALDFELAREIVEDDGIPIAYIPRAEIVADLAEADDRVGRVEILVARTADIVDDCREALDRRVHPKVAAQKVLLERAIETLEQGHLESAQALAVNICDTLITEHINESHGKAKNQCVVKNLAEAFATNTLRYTLGVAPVVNLLTEWSPKSGKPRPAPLSRHVSVHRAHPEHYTPENAVLAVMVATSLALALNERNSWD
ncbi:hypothetical protein ATM97_29035 [Nocardia sp. MH4]|nr:MULTISPECIES: hypothetical protein [Nocardia]MBW0275323.1 hypothetical protein [Nocardia sp. MH4]